MSLRLKRQMFILDFARVPCDCTSRQGALEAYCELLLKSSFATPQLFFPILVWDVAHQLAISCCARRGIRRANLHSPHESDLPEHFPLHDTKYIHIVFC